MDADRRRHIGTFLNDHLAGSTIGIERARSTRASNQGTEFAAPLARVCEEIEGDRDSLLAIIDELGVSRSKVKPALGGIGERVGRLKPNGQLRGYSPLGRVIDLEVLILGVSGKLRLWAVLGEVLDGESSADLHALTRRADGQRSTLEDLQLRATHLL